MLAQKKRLTPSYGQRRPSIKVLGRRQFTRTTKMQSFSAQKAPDTYTARKKPVSGKYKMLCAPQQRKNCLSPISLVVFLLVAIRSGTCPVSVLPLHTSYGERETQSSIQFQLFLADYFFPEGKWAALGGSAIPRQPVAGTR